MPVPSMHQRTDVDVARTLRSTALGIAAVLRHVVRPDSVGTWFARFQVNFVLPKQDRPAHARLKP